MANICKLAANKIMNKKVISTAAILVILAIILGAFGAHTLKDIISVDKLSSFETGVRYQMYQALALLIIGFNYDKLKLNSFIISLIIIGIIYFSFSIYFLSLQEWLNWNLSFLGPITPIGGVLLIIGWLMFLVRTVKS
jgi:uncharacterized membrane protein YgdD (TMEM256/DUF423 family)